jgi:hypothetical protein
MGRFLGKGVAAQSEVQHSLTREIACSISQRRRGANVNASRKEGRDNRGQL